MSEHWLRVGDNVYVRAAHITALERCEDGTVAVWVVGGGKLRAEGRAFDELREALGIAAYERAEHGVYG